MSSPPPSPRSGHISDEGLGREVSVGYHDNYKLPVGLTWVTGLLPGPKNYTEDAIVETNSSLPRKKYLVTVFHPYGKRKKI